MDGQIDLAECRVDRLDNASQSDPIELLLIQQKLPTTQKTSFLRYCSIFSRENFVRMTECFRDCPSIFIEEAANDNASKIRAPIHVKRICVIDQKQEK